MAKLWRTADFFYQNNVDFIEFTIFNLKSSWNIRIIIFYKHIYSTNIKRASKTQKRLSNLNLFAFTEIFQISNCPTFSILALSNTEKKIHSKNRNILLTAILMFKTI